MKIGLLVSRSGPAGLWAPSAEACAILAAAEINALGGVGRRPVELVISDAGADATTASTAASSLLREERVDIVAGMHPSGLCEAIGQRLSGHIPYVFTPHYEGGVIAPGVCAIGETAPDLLETSLSWLMEQRRVRRIFIVSSDCVWPRSASAHARRIIVDLGGSVVGNLTVPLGSEDFQSAIAQIRFTKPDLVLVCLTGMEGVHFNRQFADAGLQPHHLRLALGFDETALYSLGAEASHNLYAASGYFAGLRSRENGIFLERYHSAFGDSAPPPNGMGESCYEALHLIAAVANRQSDFDRFPSRAIKRAASVSSAAGWSSPARRHDALHLAAAEGLEFRLVAQFALR
jgi:urea transport system substrate-binding protein